MSLRPCRHEVLADDDDHHARGADVLLRAGVDERELRDVDRPPQEVRAHVRDERHRARRSGSACHCVPKMVLLRGDVDVGRVGVELELGLAGDAGVALVRRSMVVAATRGVAERASPRRAPSRARRR